MSSGWRRTTSAVGVALCGLLLAGCDVKGTVAVQADETLMVDMIVSEANASCPDSLSPLTLAVATVPPDPLSPGPMVSCRVTGTVTMGQLERIASLTTAGEYTAAKLELAAADIAVDTADVVVRFPGDVLATSAGTIEGNGVHVTSAADLSGLKIVALNRSGPSERLVWAAAAAAGTLLGVGVVWLLVRQLRRRPAVPDPDAPDDGPSPVDQAEEPPAAPAVPAAPESFAPPASPGTPAAEPVEDHTIWAPPKDPAHGPVD